MTTIPETLVRNPHTPSKQANATKTRENHERSNQHFSQGLLRLTTGSRSRIHGRRINHVGGYRRSNAAILPSGSKAAGDGRRKPVRIRQNRTIDWPQTSVACKSRQSTDYSSEDVLYLADVRVERRVVWPPTLSEQVSVKATWPTWNNNVGIPYAKM